jgi:hypothetical protein
VEAVHARKVSELLTFDEVYHANDASENDK